MTAATNVIILWNTNGSSPSGWTDTGDYHTGRIMYVYNDYIGGWGGASTHTHTYASNSAGNSSATHHNGGGKYMNYDTTTQAHTHSLSSTAVTSGDSFPPYKNYGLYYRALSGWDGKVPAGTVAMIGTCPTNWTKVDEGSNYFIRIVGDAATKGGTGGSSTHTHTLSGTLSALTSANAIAGASSTTPWGKDHGHTYSGSSSSQSNINDLWHCGAGLVKADAETHVTQDMYLWFDGDVPATFDGYAHGGFLRVAPSNTFTYGGSASAISHTHDNFSITSSAMSNSSNSDNYSLGANWVIEAHTHTVSGAMANTDMQPLYFILNMGKAKATFYSTVNPTYTMDTKFFGTANHLYTVDRRLKGTATATYTVDRRLKGTASLSASLDALIQKAFNPTYGLDMHLTAFFLESAYDPDVVLKIVPERTYSGQMALEKFDIESTYTPDILMQKALVNTDAKLDVLCQKLIESTYTATARFMDICDHPYVVGLFCKTGSSEIYDVNIMIIERKHTGISGRCDVMLQDIDTGYGMGLEITNRPRTYKQTRPVPSVVEPNTVPENVSGANVTLADIPGPQDNAFSYPDTTFAREDNPITDTQYEETRGNEPNVKRPFKGQIVDSTTIANPY